MEQYDSYFLQALATTALITALDNPDLKDDLFQILKFNNDSFKNIIKLSGIGNPATLQMFLYALLVAPYEMNNTVPLLCGDFLSLRYNIAVHNTLSQEQPLPVCIFPYNIIHEPGHMFIRQQTVVI